jgi:hypothetical protein
MAVSNYLRKEESTEAASAEAGPDGLRVCSEEIQGQAQRVVACLAKEEEACRNFLSIAGQPDATGTVDVSAALGALKEGAYFACADLHNDGFHLHQGSPWTIPVDRVIKSDPPVLYTKGSTVILNDRADRQISDSAMAATLITTGWSVLRHQRDPKVDEVGTANDSQWKFGNPLMMWLEAEGGAVTTTWAAPQVQKAMDQELTAPKLESGEEPPLEFLGNSTQ